MKLRLSSEILDLLGTASVSSENKAIRTPNRCLFVVHVSPDCSARTPSLRDLGHPRASGQSLEFIKNMPEKKTIERARRDKEHGKAPSTQAGEFVREEMEHIRKGKHGARSTKQAIAIGLSKARRAGVNLPPPKTGTTSEATRRKAQKDLEKGKTARRPSARRSAATTKALQRESRASASKEAHSAQGHASARRRTRGEKSVAASKTAKTRAAKK